jgi:hypothetical protein
LMKIGKCINQQILFDELDAFQGWCVLCTAIRYANVFPKIIFFEK